MNSLELPAPFNLSTDTSHWDEVRRIYRRVCILRALGNDQDASLLENRDLARALATARESAESDHEETAVLAAESERVLNASITAELLAPLLADRLSTSLAPAASRLAPTVRERIETPAPRSSETTVAATPTLPPRAPGGVPSITDLIDGMLSQES